MLAWPATSSFAKKGLTTKDMAAAEPAVCKPRGRTPCAAPMKSPSPAPKPTVPRGVLPGTAARR
ncbi:DUF5707 domain-containing protein [Streptomyces sp. NPDC102270]|uniref:DUF5707 domain-containing protein n=1 Tax=Streptomyces sp. NPDC102270 TaxID=3366150 RepID=UPI003830A1B2